MKLPEKGGSITFLRTFAEAACMPLVCGAWASLTWHVKSRMFQKFLYETFVISALSLGGSYEYMVVSLEPSNFWYLSENTDNKSHP